MSAELGKSREQMVIAIANQKGGVGKTTTAVSLASALARMGKKVMVIDLDPHACASVHLRLYPDDLKYTIKDIFGEGVDDWKNLWGKILHPSPDKDFFVAPASIRLSELDIDLRDRKGKGAILQKSLKKLPDHYDYILLDCPPHVGILLVNALVACNLLIIPIQTDFLALHGLKLLFDTIRVLNKALPEPIDYRVLPTLYDRRANACARVMELLKEKMPESLFEVVIGMDTRFRDASAQGRVIYEIAPKSRGALEYEDLAREIVEL